MKKGIIQHLFALDARVPCVPDTLLFHHNVPAHQVMYQIGFTCGNKSYHSILKPFAKREEPAEFDNSSLEKALLS